MTKQMFVVQGMNREDVRMFVGTDLARVLEPAVAMMPENLRHKTRREGLAPLIEGRRVLLPGDSYAVLVDGASMIMVCLAEVS